MKRTAVRVAVALAFFAACVALPASAGEAQEKGAAAETPEKAAQAAAEQWLALVDADNSAESWKQAATIFKEKLSAEQWEEAVKSVHSQTGKLVSRKFRTAELKNGLPGAPPGDFVILKYDTSFEKENAKAATETVVPFKEKDGSWRVSGYFVK